MPKASTLQSNFSAGEMSPLLYGRTESPRYKQGLDTAINYIPCLQGPLIRRPGTKYMNAVKDSTKPPVLIPFQFSITQAYMLEFGDKYIRFYTNNGQILTSGTTYRFNSAAYNYTLPLYASRASATPKDGETGAGPTTVTGGSILEISSPYAYTDLQNLKYCQTADTLYLFHPSYPAFKLQRYGQQLWDLKQLYLQDGPYLAYNSYLNTADSANITLAISYLVSAAPLFFAQMIAGPALLVSGTANNGGKIKITTSTAHGLFEGQKIFISGITGTTEANNNDYGGTWAGHPYYWTITVDSTNEFTLVGSTYANAYTAGGGVNPALFWQNIGVAVSAAPDYNRNVGFVSGGKRYWGVISGFASAAEIQIYTGPYINPVQFPVVTTVATAWQLGVYSNNAGPACGTFHQNRLVMGGALNYPQQVDFSYVGQYENFAISPPVTDATAIPPQTALQPTATNAMQFTLASSEINPLQWLKSSAQGLLAGSATAEWSMSPSSNSDALTSTNFNASQTSFYGSANADAVLMGQSVFYIQRAQRKVRELHYFFQVGTFRSTDMTELSEHITNPSITKILCQKETQPLLWAVRSDGALLSMIYNRDDASVQAGWVRHFLGGQSDASGTAPIVQSIGIIPAPDLSFDQLWMTVKRWINGASVICIEYMTKIFDDVAKQEDAFQGDCGATYDVYKSITAITTASPLVITSATHGFNDGDRVRFDEINGLNLITTDVNGNSTTANLLNGRNFLVANKGTNSFELTDYEGNAISSVGYTAYVSGGKARKLVKTISGLTWLENETVSVLVDGGIHPDVTVSNAGAITLQYPGGKIQIGYKYNSDGKLLRVEGGAADGTSIGKTRRTSRAAFQLHRTGGLSIGTEFSRLLPLKFLQAEVQIADTATPLYSGIQREGLESAYDFESQICWRDNSMLPGTIQSITSFMEEQDV